MSVEEKLKILSLSKEVQVSLRRTWGKEERIIRSEEEAAPEMSLKGCSTFLLQCGQGRLQVLEAKKGGREVWKYMKCLGRSPYYCLQGNKSRVAELWMLSQLQISRAVVDVMEGKTRTTAWYRQEDRLWHNILLSLKEEEIELKNLWLPPTTVVYLLQMTRPGL